VPETKSEPKRELTRREVAHRFGVSEWQIDRFEKDGLLKARRDEKKRVWYDPLEVDALAASWRPSRRKRARVDTRIVESNVRGKVAARAFAILNEMRGQSIEDAFRRIVIETEADPLLVRQAVREWELGVEKAKKLEADQLREEEDRERQRNHEKRDREEKFRQWKLRLATIEATGKKRA